MATCGIQVIWHEEDAGEASVGYTAVILSDNNFEAIAWAS